MYKIIKFKKLIPVLMKSQVADAFLKFLPFEINPYPYNC